MDIFICLFFTMIFSVLLFKFDNYELSKNNFICLFLTNILSTTLLIFKPYDTLTALCLIIIFSLLNIIFLIDFKFKEIPNLYVCIITIFALAFYISKIGSYPIDFVPLIKDGLLYTIVFMGLMVLSGGALGAGDVKLVFPLGILLTNIYYLEYIGYTFLSGAIIALILLLFKKYDKKDKIAFGPFMIVSFYFIFFSYI